MLSNKTEWKLILRHHPWKSGNDESQGTNSISNERLAFKCANSCLPPLTLVYMTDCAGRQGPPKVNYNVVVAIFATVVIFVYVSASGLGKAVVEFSTADRVGYRRQKHQQHLLQPSALQSSAFFKESVTWARSGESEILATICSVNWKFVSVFITLTEAELLRFYLSGRDWQKRKAPRKSYTCDRKKKTVAFCTCEGETRSPGTANNSRSLNACVDKVCHRRRAIATECWGSNLQV